MATWAATALSRAASAASPAAVASRRASAISSLARSNWAAATALRASSRCAWPRRPGGGVELRQGREQLADRVARRRQVPGRRRGLGQELRGAGADLGIGAERRGAGEGGPRRLQGPTAQRHASGRDEMGRAARLGSPAISARSAARCRQSPAPLPQVDSTSSMQRVARVARSLGRSSSRMASRVRAWRKVNPACWTASSCSATARLSRSWAAAGLSPAAPLASRQSNCRPSRAAQPSRRRPSGPISRTRCRTDWMKLGGTRGRSGAGARPASVDPGQRPVGDEARPAAPRRRRGPPPRSHAAGRRPRRGRRRWRGRRGSWSPRRRR